MNEWKHQLEHAFTQQFGQKKGALLNKKYIKAFPAGYVDDHDIKTALNDIQHIEKISKENKLEVYFYTAGDEAHYQVHLRLFQWQKFIPLSDVLPMLENFGLRTVEEHPYKITLQNRKTVWIKDFSLQYKQENFNMKKAKELFPVAFSKVYYGMAENDGFNKLILGAALSWREIIILRMYAKYLHQIHFQYSQFYIENALVKNANITKDLVKFFYILHDPLHSKMSAAKAKKLEKRIFQQLETVPDLDEDTIVRRILSLIKATLRTNYFQHASKKDYKDYISIKLNSHAIPELPLPKPLYETFVYSPRLEGIHLRHAKIARGGIRWSDRQSDYRTEILGLMKAQVVKNSVIVPSGAKGGFILKSLPPHASREEIKQEVIRCYTTFISGLLDLVDNIKNGKLIPPKEVVCYDDKDPYLVVAADKGTATFSDIANQISAEYNFWLGDAFASGGSTGYDHKKMGITARGAWESVKRHFRVLEMDINQMPITVVGIGDMSGDVFGNGMLYTDKIKLIGAFDHRHIFIDPTPNPERSYLERQRLFNLSGSSWEDYEPSLISKGGGVFKRSLKSITITKPIKKALGIQADTLTPNELIKALLKAPVDLIFNGGIGTYVKSSLESNAEVSDRVNDACRVNGHELQCKVVGEGGNLGFTQRGRIEFAQNGGLIYTDFIDNSAGVDCSDHEVNLKILLNREVQLKKLTIKVRNQLLSSLTEDIASLVLEDNYNQALALSFIAFSAAHDIGQYGDYIRTLESQRILNRKVEYLPSDKELVERKVAGIGLTRPELAVLFAYTKIHLKHEILNSNLTDDPYLQSMVEIAFPKAVCEKYSKQVHKHQLKQYIIATELANEVVNNMGIIFVYRIQVETGATIEDIIRAYVVVTRIFETQQLQHMVETLDFKISLNEQFEIIKNIHNLIMLSTRWFLQENRLKPDLKKLISEFSLLINPLEKIIPDLMGGETKKYLTKLTENFENAGLSRSVAKRIATYRAIYTVLNIIEVSRAYRFEIIKTAQIYFTCGERLNLLWFRDQIANDAREGQWNTLARLALRNELDTAQRALTIAIMKTTPDIADAHERVENWVNNKHDIIARWENLLSMLHSSASIEYSMFFIVIREFIRLVNTSSKEK